MEENSRLHAMVEGSVQGVGFRQFVLKTAIQLNLTGWVRNTYQGSVEVIAEGRSDILDALLFALKQGPRHAYVTHVNSEFLPASGEFADFTIQFTV